MRIAGLHIPRVWWLDWHYNPHGGGRTRIGQLVYRAKPYKPAPGSGWGSKGSEPPAVSQLATLMYERARIPPRGPLEVDAVVGVPAAESKATINLPDVLAEEIAGRAGLAYRPGLVVKVRDTPEMKQMPEEEKAEALDGAFEGVHSRPVPDRVLVVDDLVLSGHTLDAVAGALFAVGVRRVVAYAASRVRWGMA